MRTSPPEVPVGLHLKEQPLFGAQAPVGTLRLSIWTLEANFAAESSRSQYKTGILSTHVLLRNGKQIWKLLPISSPLKVTRCYFLNELEYWVKMFKQNKSRLLNTWIPRNLQGVMLSLLSPSLLQCKILSPCCRERAEGNEGFNPLCWLPGSQVLTVEMKGGQRGQGETQREEPERKEEEEEACISVRKEREGHTGKMAWVPLETL